MVFVLINDKLALVPVRTETTSFSIIEFKPVNVRIVPLIPVKLVKNPVVPDEASRGKLKEMGFPGFVAAILVAGLPKLKRWKK